MTATDASATPAGRGGTGPTLSVGHMDVVYKVRGRDRLALRDVSFEVGRRESYGLVGESGSGKSTVALALTRYLPRNGRVSAGTVSINGADPLGMSGADLRHLRARTVSMVYQEPGKALNPSIRVGRQVAEVYEIAGLHRAEAAERAEAMLRKVQIADPGRVMSRYAHQLSGGMAQRVVIAMALAAEPALLILDEPTTALDATVEAEVLDLVSALRAEFDTSVLFISHNLAVIAKMCDRWASCTRASWWRRARPARCSRTRATPTRSGCCAASRAAASARTTGGWTPSRDSCRRPGTRSAGACSPRAACSPRTAAARRRPRRTRSRLPGPRAATGMTWRRACRGPRRRTSRCPGLPPAPRPSSSWPGCPRRSVPVVPVLSRCTRSPGGPGTGAGRDAGAGR